MTKIIDCTIRDGGHLNGWNYTDECVLASYNAAVAASVDYFEVGYRMESPNVEWGKWSKSNDKDLFEIFGRNPKIKLSVMIDAGKSNINDFQECNSNNTPIKTVRVSTYPNKLEIAFKLCESLKNKGYEVVLNLMAMSEYKNEDLEKIKKHKIPTLVDAVCFADSFGSFYPNDIVKYKNSLEETGFEKICFHPHNNLQLAFANSLTALEHNFYAIDASIYGMGRGAGILPIELITGYLKGKYDPVPYLKVIEKYYKQLQTETPWGYSLPSLIGGLKNIHPNYMKALCKHHFNTETIWNKAELIKQNAPVFFDKEYFKKFAVD